MIQTKDSKKEKMEAKFSLVIPDEVYQKIMWWIWKSKFEVSGFGKVTYDEKTKEFTVVDAVLLKQKNTSVSTEIDAEAIGKMMYETREMPGFVWWWHSHVQMNCFWSSDDMAAIRELASNGQIFATVLNQKYEMRSAYMTTTEIHGQRQEIFIDDIPSRTVRMIPHELYSKWDKDYEDHVSIETVPTSNYGIGGTNSWYDKQSSWYKDDDRYEWVEEYKDDKGKLIPAQWKWKGDSKEKEELSSTNTQSSGLIDDVYGNLYLDDYDEADDYDLLNDEVDETYKTMTRKQKLAHIATSLGSTVAEFEKHMTRPDYIALDRMTPMQFLNEYYLGVGT
jgi:hypothetical protein